MTEDESRALLKKFGPCPDETRGSVFKTAILKTLRDADEPMSCPEIAEYAGLSTASVYSVVGQMARGGVIKRVARGLYTA